MQYQIGQRVIASSALDGNAYKAFIIHQEGDKYCVKYNEYAELEWLYADALSESDAHSGVEPTALIEQAQNAYHNLRNISAQGMTPANYQKFKDAVSKPAFAIGERVISESAQDKIWYEAFVIFMEGDKYCVKYNNYLEVEWQYADALKSTPEHSGAESDSLVTDAQQNYLQFKNISTQGMTPENYLKPAAMGGSVNEKAIRADENKRTRVEIAKTALSMGLQGEVIANLTGLTLEEVEALVSGGNSLT